MPDPALHAFGQNLRAARERRKLSVADLAEKLGVSAIAVYKWEAGTNDPRLTRLLDIAAALSTSPAKLLPKSDPARAQ